MINIPCGKVISLFHLKTLKQNKLFQENINNFVLKTFSILNVKDKLSQIFYIFGLVTRGLHIYFHSTLNTSFSLDSPLFFPTLNICHHMY